MNEFSYTVLYCIILHELKCYFEDDFVVFCCVWLDWLKAEFIFRRRRQAWTNSDLSKEGHGLPCGRRQYDDVKHDALVLEHM